VSPASPRRPVPPPIAPPRPRTDRDLRWTWGPSVTFRCRPRVPPSVPAAPRPPIPAGHGVHPLLFVAARTSSARPTHFRTGLNFAFSRWSLPRRRAAALGLRPRGPVPMFPPHPPGRAEY
jgi:hypothetical protein